MRVDVVITEPTVSNPGVEVSADGTNPVQLVLRRSPIYSAMLTPDEALRLADTLTLPRRHHPIRRRRRGSR